MTSPTEIRDAIEKVIPTDGPLGSDIKVRDGLADISIKCGTLRWTQTMAVQNLTPKTAADIVGEQVKAWLKGYISNMMDAEGKASPHHRRSISSVRDWLDGNPKRREWLYGKEKKKMYDDAKIRMRLLNAFPWVEPYRVEMEEYDFGDRLGIAYLNPAGERVRAQVDAKGRSDESIFEVLQPLAATLFGPAPKIVSETVAEAAPIPAVAEEDAPPVVPKKGRHKNSCQCERCMAKKSYHVAA